MLQVSFLCLVLIAKELQREDRMSQLDVLDDFTKIIRQAEWVLDDFLLSSQDSGKITSHVLTGLF